MIPVTRLNHAMLYVRDLDRSVTFYREAFGMVEVWRDGPVALLRTIGSQNHHDLAFLAVGEDAPRPPRAPPGCTTWRGRC